LECPRQLFAKSLRGYFATYAGFEKVLANNPGICECRVYYDMKHMDWSATF